MGIDDHLIKEIIRRILRVAQPDRIILFGSAAGGQMTKDSDIDLLILEKAPGNVNEEWLRLRRALSGMGYPFDILIMSLEGFEESKQVIGSLAYPAHKYGKLIYESAG